MRHRTAYLVLALIPAAVFAQDRGLDASILVLEGKVSELSYRVTDLQGNSVREVVVATEELAISESPTETRIYLSGDVLFEFDRAALNPEAEKMLGELAQLLHQSAGARIRIEGHTDSRGEEDYNQRLSMLRAAAVRNWLVDRGRIDAGAMEIAGWGEQRPLVPNVGADGGDEPEGRRKNRRVEIIVSKS